MDALSLTRLQARLDSLLASPLIVAGLIWAVLAAVQLYAGWAFVMTGRSGDPDSAMRLLEIRDWLGGQGWSDLSQYRLGPAGGTAMHWSRLADILPASIIALLAPLVGQADAERLARIATPLIYLFPMIFLSVAIARNLAGRAVDAILTVILLTSFGALVLFGPGAIDHHNLQLVLVLIIVWAGSGARRAFHGAIAGTATVASMTVGIEHAPEIAAALAAMGLLWIADPAQEARFFRAIGLGLMASATVSLIVFMPHPWPIDYCDAWTPAIVILMISGGAMVTALSHSALALRSGYIGRTVVLGMGAAVLGVAVAWAFPACLRYPAGDDMISWRYWMDGISELQSLPALLADQGPGPVVIVLNASPLVIVAAGWLAMRRAERAWCVPLLTALVALGMTVAQVRAQAFLGALTAILAAALVARILAQSGARSRIAALAFMPIAWMLAGAAMLKPEAPRTVADQAACYSDSVYAMLRRLPPSLIVVPITAEPHILLATAHRSLGGTYHRNLAGNHAMIGAMIAHPDAAAPMLRKAGAHYLLYCPGFDIGSLYAKGIPESLAAALVANRAPAWLKPVDRLPHDIRLYRID